MLVDVRMVDEIHKPVDVTRMLVLIRKPALIRKMVVTRMQVLLRNLVVTRMMVEIHKQMHVDRMVVWIHKMVEDVHKLVEHVGHMEDVDHMVVRILLLLRRIFVMKCKDLQIRMVFVNLMSETREFIEKNH